MSANESWLPIAMLVLFWGAVALLVWLIIRSRKRAARRRLVDGKSLAPWNTLSIIAIASSFSVILLPVVLAIIALVQISRTGEQGRVLAVIALVFQSLAVLGFVLYVSVGDVATAP